MTEYEKQVRDAAARQKAAVDSRYNALISRAESDYEKSAEDTAAQYQTAFDANAVDEIVARRNAAEAIANSNMANSGLNNTQHTAISLQRQRADNLTVNQRQAAVDSIMRQLDALKTGYVDQAAQEKASIDAAADNSVTAYTQAMAEAAPSGSGGYTEPTETSQQRFDNIIKMWEKGGYASYDEAAAAYDAQKKAYLGSFGADDRTKAKAMSNLGAPSITAIDAKAKTLAYKGRTDELAQYLNEQVDRGYITPYQRNQIEAKYTMKYGVDTQKVNNFAKNYSTRAQWDASANVRMDGTSYDAYLQKTIIPAIVSKANSGQLSEAEVQYLFQVYGITADML